MKKIGTVSVDVVGIPKPKIYDVMVTRYPSGKAPAVILKDPEGNESWDIVFSVNLVSYGGFLHAGEFHVKNWGENEGLDAAMMRTGLFADTGRREPSGYVEAPVWRFLDEGNVPALNEGS